VCLLATAAPSCRPPLSFAPNSVSIDPASSLIYSHYVHYSLHRYRSVAVLTPPRRPPTDRYPRTVGRPSVYAHLYDHIQYFSRDFHPSHNLTIPDHHTRRYPNAVAALLFRGPRTWVEWARQFFWESNDTASPLISRFLAFFPHTCMYIHTLTFLYNSQQVLVKPLLDRGGRRFFRCKWLPYLRLTQRVPYPAMAMPALSNYSTTLATN